MVMPSDMAALTTDDAKLAISVEPPKGSPTDGPSGPMVAIGALQKI
jgi:anti-sigma-K factor RskA